MRTAAPADSTRHRLLEGVLLRLARLPDAGGLVVRGGVLLRHWFRPLVRPAEDLDLVATPPFGVDDAARLLVPILADDSVGDGVSFDPGCVRVEAICLRTDLPGVRLHACGGAGGDEVDFHVDITPSPPTGPAPVLVELPTACGKGARVWACRPEAVAGHKVQALAHLGATGWRPKDLDDLRLLVERVPMDAGALRSAVGASLGAIGRGPAGGQELFGTGSWWGMKLSAGRWADYVQSPRGRNAPRSLAEVVAAVAGRLGPLLEGVP